MGDCAHKRSDAKVATSTLLNDKGCEHKYRFICDGKDFVPKKRFVAVDSTKSWTEANAYCASLEWWNKNEPNNWRGEDCAHKRSDAKVATSTLLNDKGCEHKYRFICDGKD